MKANRKFHNRNDRAEVGVGTLIVFIAMVLVAAVAAAVLINTSGTLQQRAQQTGKEATQEVSSNLKVTGIYGTRNSSSLDLWQLKLNLELSAGALPLDMQQTVVRFSDGENTRTYSYSASYAVGTPSATFGLTWIRGDGTNQVMETGDLVELAFNMRSHTVAERQPVQLLLIPEVGTPVSADFTTPATYDDDTTVTLRS